MFIHSSRKVIKIIYTCGGQRSALAVSLLAVHLVRQNLIGIPHFVGRVNWPISFWGFFHLPPPPHRCTGVTDAHCHTGLYEFWESEVRSLHCIASALPTEPPPQPKWFALKANPRLPFSTSLRVDHHCPSVLLFPAALMPLPLLALASFSRRRDAFLSEHPWRFYCTYIVPSAHLSCILLFTVPFLVSHYKRG